MGTASDMDWHEGDATTAVPQQAPTMDQVLRAEQELLGKWEPRALQWRAPGLTFPCVPLKIDST